MRRCRRRTLPGTAVRDVDFVVTAGARGMVTPVSTSELFLLAGDERRRLTTDLGKLNLAELDDAVLAVQVAL